MADLRWSPTPPAEPGWYWLRHRAGGEPGMAHVKMGPDGRPVMSPVGYYPSRPADREWAGPLPFPLEPLAPGPLTERIAAVRAAGGSDWDAIDDPAAYLGRKGEVGGE